MSKLFKKYKGEGKIRVGRWPKCQNWLNFGYDGSFVSTKTPPKGFFISLIVTLLFRGGPGGQGGQKRGKIELSCKYVMWGIKLLLLIAQTYLSYLWYKYILRLASNDLNDLNGGILEVKMEVKLKLLVSISCGVSNSCFWYHKLI